MDKLERKVTLLENEDFVIKRPTKIEELEIEKMIENYNSQDEKSKNEIILNLLKELVIPNCNQIYDFSNYTALELEEMLSDSITQYDYLEEIVFTINKLIYDIIIKKMRRELLEVKKLEVMALSNVMSYKAEKVQKIHSELKAEKDKDRIKEIRSKRDLEYKPLKKLNRKERREMERKHEKIEE